MSLHSSNMCGRFRSRHEEFRRTPWNRQHTTRSTLNAHNTVNNPVSCLWAGADLLVHVQLGGVLDDLGGHGHAPRPQLHLLGLLPVVQSSTAHPGYTNTNTPPSLYKMWFSKFRSMHSVNISHIILVLVVQTDRLTHLVMTLQKSGT